jgi:hypothetical protein
MRRFYLHELNELYSKSTMPNSLSSGRTNSESSLSSSRLFEETSQQPHRVGLPHSAPLPASNISSPMARTQITSSYLPIPMNSTQYSSPQLFVQPPAPHLDRPVCEIVPPSLPIPPPIPYLDRPVCEIVPPSQPQLQLELDPPDFSSDSLPPLLDIMLLPSAPSHDVIALPDVPTHAVVCESDQQLRRVELVELPEAVEICERGIAMATRRINRPKPSPRGSLNLPESVLPHDRRKCLVEDAISLELNLRMSILVHEVTFPPPPPPPYPAP